jgi:hypothetical protein
MEAVLSTTGSAGFVFDRYGDSDYKFVTVDQTSSQVLLGHSTSKGGVVIDAAAALPAVADDLTLRVRLTGNVVTVAVNGTTVLSHAYFALVTDGRFGLIALSGVTSFDSYSVQTTDPDTVTDPMTSLLALLGELSLPPPY